MGNFLYVYIIDSESKRDRYYIGITRNIEDRLKSHNKGDVKSTKAFRPWKVRTCIAFADQQRATDFEKYLKSHSGRAFISKHL